MRWLYYILLSLPVALIGLFAGGFIGNACVRWYRVSSFEGGAGYAMIAIALLGGIVGLITGLVTTGLLAPHGGLGHLKAFAASVGVLSLIAFAATGICWSLADIPPEIDGRPLTLEVEIRLPVTVTRSPAEGVGDSSLSLYSVNNHVSRGHADGSLRPRDARLENGRWIIPGEVAVFTMRGLRSLSIKLNGEDVQGFIVPLPARPGKEFLQWSDWGPRPPAPEPPWPDTKPSYRFRVQKVPEPPRQPTYEEIQAQADAEEQAKFDAISVDSPIPTWFPYIYSGAREDRLTTAVKKMTSRPAFQAELAQLMRDPDPRTAEGAMRLVEHLTEHPPELLAAVSYAGRDIAERIRKFNDIPGDGDPAMEAANDASIRFSAWMAAVRPLREKAHGDFTPELGAILQLSRVRTDSAAMRSDIRRVASYYMKQWAGMEPLPGDPRPN